MQEIQDLIDKNNAFEEACLYFETDAKGIILYANKKFCDLCGYDAHELVGNKPSLFKSGQTSSDEYALFWQTINAGLQWQWEICNRTKSGDLFWVTEIIIPIVDTQNGHIKKFLSVVTNIAKRKKAEKEKEKSDSLLRHTQRQESIGQLTSGIAHDFNNILTPIQGFARLAIKYQENNQPDQVIACLERVEKASKRAIDLVEKLLIYSRKDTVKPEHPISPANVINEVTSMGSMLRAGISSTIDIQFVNELPQTAPLILIDESELHQILTNLVINARDAIEASSQQENKHQITIRAFVNPFSTDFPCKCNICGEPLKHTCVTISVSDTGVGMTSEQIARIFEPFYTSKEAGKGTGLGLPIISSILHNNYAHLTISSTLNVGSIFYLHFPAIFAAQQTPKASVNRMITQQAAFNICIVDDDVLTCDLFREKFLALGYEIKVFNDSLVANTYFGEHLNSYDAVIIDIAMPKLSGLELANTLLTKCPDIPIIFLTGYSKDNISDLHLPSGNTFLFRKPYATATEIHCQLVEFFSHKNAINKKD